MNKYSQNELREKLKEQVYDVLDEDSEDVDCTFAQFEESDIFEDLADENTIDAFLQRVQQTEIYKEKTGSKESIFSLDAVDNDGDCTYVVRYPDGKNSVSILTVYKFRTVSALLDLVAFDLYKMQGGIT